MNKTLIGIVAVLGFIAMWLVGQYNGLVNTEENVNQARSQVENQYQRRADLIPNLVNTVKGIANQETRLFTEVTEARAKATQTTIDINDAESLAQYQAAQGELSSALSRLLVSVEAYPELKSNENFLQLQAQLEGTENRLSTERRSFNQVATVFNKKVRIFPTNMIAGFLGFERKPLFESEQGADKAPDVNFDFE